MTQIVVRPSRPEAGVTLIELMIAMLLSTIATGFLFATYARSSTAYRAQTQVSETQQSLRSAGDLLVHEIRMAGLLVREYKTPVAGNAAKVYSSIDVINAADAEGSDVLRVAYADTSTLARVLTLAEGGYIWTGFSAKVDSITGFAPGDLVFAARTREPKLGRGCLLAISSVSGSASPYTIDFALMAPWGMSGSMHCAGPEGISIGWDDGYTLITRASLLAYRIKPDDTKGILQRSPTGGFISGDWVDLAAGFVDLQVAVRVSEPDSTTDFDGDGIETRNWHSGETMETVFDVAGRQPTQIRMTVVARSAEEVEVKQPATTPVITNSAMPVGHNDLGDQMGLTLPVTNPSSRYHGDHLYRTSTSYIDLRNMGVGI